MSTSQNVATLNLGGSHNRSIVRTIFIKAERMFAPNRKPTPKKKLIKIKINIKFKSLEQFESLSKINFLPIEHIIDDYMHPDISMIQAYFDETVDLDVSKINEF